MSSNIYRFSPIGETLIATLDELLNDYKINKDVKEQILDRFDEVF